MEQPAELRGRAAGGKVELPDLFAPSEVGGEVPNPDAPARRLGIAVVGLGHLTLEQILPGFAQARHARVTALVSGDRDVEAVYVVLPNDMHLEYTVRAAQAGKHVLCEKPMATTVADAERMVEACRAARRTLMIAYRMQYEPHHRALIGMAQGGQFGPVRLIDAVNGQNEAPNQQWRHSRKQAGGGSLPDVGIYCLNAARYVTGEEPSEVIAQITQPKDDPRFAEVEDICAFTLRFPSGVVASCTTGYSHHESRYMRVMMRDAWVEMSPAFPYQGVEMRIGRKEGKAHVVEQRRFAERNQFAREMDHFAERVRAGKPVHTPGEEGLQDQRIIAAIYEAAAGGSVVKLPNAGRSATRGPDPDEQA